MAILLRSVKANAEPITKALDRAGIKYIVGGMSTLFDTKEAQAARALFYFLASRADVGKPQLVDAWREADLGLDGALLAAGVEQAASAREAFADEDASKFRLYGLQRQYLSFLEAVEIREDAVPRGRGEVVLYNLGKFSQVISDFESIH
jgi:DNA helicase-2/ATP-dependent DNA helicase PcrA